MSLKLSQPSSVRVVYGSCPHDCPDCCALETERSPAVRRSRGDPPRIVVLRAVRVAPRSLARTAWTFRLERRNDSAMPRTSARLRRHGDRALGTDLSFVRAAALAMAGRNRAEDGARCRLINEIESSLPADSGFRSVRSTSALLVRISPLWCRLCGGSERCARRARGNRRSRRCSSRGRRCARDSWP